MVEVSTVVVESVVVDSAVVSVEKVVNSVENWAVKELHILLNTFHHNFQTINHLMG